MEGENEELDDERDFHIGPLFVLQFPVSKATKQNNDFLVI